MTDTTTANEAPTVALDNGTSVPCVFVGTLQLHVADWPIAGDANGRTAPHLHVQDVTGGAGEIVPLNSARATALGMQSDDVAAMIEDAAAQQPEAVAASAPATSNAAVLDAVAQLQAEIAALRAQQPAASTSTTTATEPPAPPAPPAPGEGESDGGDGSTAGA